MLFRSGHRVWQDRQPEYALRGLQHIAAIPFQQETGCPTIGSEVASLFGDVDRDNDVASVDSLKVLQNDL